MADSDWQSDPSGYISQFLGSPVQITSGLRSPAKNAAVGGVPNSAHLSGQAFDFVLPNGMDSKTAASKLAASGIPFDQIEDGGDHVHISFAPKLRRQVIMGKSNISDDDLLNTIGSQQAAPVKNVSDDDLLGALGGQQSAAPAAPGKAATPSVPADKQPWLQRASAGVVQGARDVVSSVDPIAQWVDKKIGPVTLGGLLPTADQAHAYNVNARDTFNSTYGNDLTAGGGRVLGQVAGSLPALAAGGEVLAPLASAARVAAPASAPLINFLSGTGGAGTLSRLASKGAAGALQGGAAAAATSSASDEDIGDQIKEGAEFGGTLGSVLPGAKKLGGAAYNSLFGGGMNPARAALAQEAIDRFGIPLRGSQISQSPFAKLADSAIGKMPMSGLESQNAAQRTAFTRAVAGTFGEDADNLTPKVMSSARDRIGSVFNRVGGNTTISSDATGAMADKFASIESEAQQVMGDNEYKPIKNQMNGILAKVADDGTIDGKTYQALTRKGAPLDAAMGSKDPNIRQYAGQIRSALDDALQASANPQDLADLKQARLQWKNMRTVQDLASKAGIEGEITPAGLLGAVKKSYKDMAYSGAGDIGKLADIGQEFLKEGPNSTTAERLLLYRILEGGSIGSAGAFAAMNPEEIPKAALGIGGLLAAGKMGGSALKSNLYRNYVLRNAAPSAGTGAANLYDLLARSNAIRHYGVPTALSVRNNLLAPSSGQ